MNNDTIFDKYPLWDCNIYYDAGTIVIYGGTLCVASGLGIEPEVWEA